MLLERIADWGTSLSIPDSNGVIVGSGDDVASIGRVGNGRHQASVPLERLVDCGTSLGIPDSNSVIVGSGDDVAPIGRVGNRPHRATVPLEKMTGSRPNSSNSPFYDAVVWFGEQ